MKEEILENPTFNIIYRPQMNDCPIILILEYCLMISSVIRIKTTFADS
jgi:hypothetical protein